MFIYCNFVSLNLKTNIYMEQLFLELTEQESINTFGGKIIYMLIYDEDAGSYRPVFVNA